MSQDGDSLEAFEPKSKKSTTQMLDTIAELKRQNRQQKALLEELEEKIKKLRTGNIRLSSSNNQYKERIKRLEDRLAELGENKRVTKAAKPTVQSDKGAGKTSFANTAAPDLSGLDRIREFEVKHAEYYRQTLDKFSKACTVDNPFGNHKQCFFISPQKGSHALDEDQSKLKSKRPQFTLVGFGEHHLGERVPAAVLAAYAGSKILPDVDGTSTFKKGSDASHLCHVPGCVNWRHLVCESPSKHKKRDPCQATRTTAQPHCKCENPVKCYTVHAARA